MIDDREITHGEHLQSSTRSCWHMLSLRTGWVPLAVAFLPWDGTWAELVNVSIAERGALS
eukprot:1663742-Amphidinium_carterae.3